MRSKNPSKDKGKGKGKEVGTSRAPSPPPMPSLQLFRTEDQHERYSKFFEYREVLGGRVMDIQFLESINFPYIETFETFGWWNFLKINRCIYEDVVRAFYSNADNTIHKKKSDKKFRTSIGQTNLEVTYVMLHNQFGIPGDGVEYSDWNKDYVLASREVIENPELTIQITDTSLMDLHTRILHLICCQMLYPRNGSFSVVTRMDLWLMYCIKARRRPNLITIIMKHMIESFSGNNRSLPYGMAISELLDKEVGNLGDAKQVWLNPSQHINANTAIRAGFVIRNRTWVRADRSKKRKGEEGTSVTIEPQEEEPSQGRSGSRQELDDSFSRFKEEMRTDLQGVKTDLQKVRSDIQGVRTDLQEFKQDVSTQLGQIIQLMQSRLPQPAESSPSSTPPYQSPAQDSTHSPEF